MLPVSAALLPLTSASISGQVLSFGIWAYLFIFIVILIASTIVGGAIPDNTFIILIGAASPGSELSVLWVVVSTALGGFAGYEINYWSGRLFGLTICQRTCPGVLHDKNVEKALDMMERFGPVSLVLSRFMPVLNMPSFIAGVDAMEYPRYVVFNLISSVIWCGTLLVLGYYIGSIAIIDRYLDDLTDLVFIIMIVAVLVVLIMFARDYVNARAAALRSR